MTPMMKQYHAMKARYEGAILFFHLGDFYEAFYEDAKTCSEVLGITLTARSKDGGRIPMAGIPIRAAQGYMEKLLTTGHKVAVCDQVQDPAEARGIVKREVTRVLTPGTVTEGGLIDEKGNNFLLAVCSSGRSAGLSWADLSTGEFFMEDCAIDSLADEVSRVDPSEILVRESESPETVAAVSGLGCMITTQADHVFERASCFRRLTEHLGVNSLDGFGCADAETSVGAAGAVLQYLSETQKDALPHISSVRMHSRSSVLSLDRNTRRNLDLLESAGTGEGRFSLLWTLDRTATAMGGRLLRSWISAPLVDVAAIRRRHDAVEELLAPGPRGELAASLKEVRDMERLCARVSCERANGRDLVSLRDSLRMVPDVKRILTGMSSAVLSGAGESMDPLSEAAADIGDTLVDEPPAEVTEGGMIREGVDEKLDALRSLSSDGKGWIASLEAEEKKRTGIPSLKIGFNRVFGYYLEVTNTHRDKVPVEWTRKQTLKNAERYITEELKEHETRVLTAEEECKEIERRIFSGLRARVAGEAERIQATARALATVDVLNSLAQAAAENGYCRPAMTDSEELIIREGRHPVVEMTLKAGEFTPNDTELDEKGNLMILTGPNMSGKSTYIRQVALICIMAQAGSFVPAKEATVGVVDRVFTRVGASDEIARGQSTFMVEMNETALILNNATTRSLIILDEVGRGTSTLDGLSIAWAVGEDIHERVGARTLFATHYHELTGLAGLLERAVNFNVAVREWGEEVIFLHRIEPGETDKSYGIHVAKLAGVPKTVIERAKTILQQLENQALDPSGKPALAASGSEAGERQLPLFDIGPSRIEEEISGLDVDAIAPVDALLKLRELKQKIEATDGDAPIGEGVK